MVDKTTDKKHNELLDIMEQFMDKQEPKVGIFWYNYVKHELFGCQSVEVSSIKLNAKGIGTIGKLHQDFWKKQYHKAHVKNDIDSPYYKKFNYTLIPQGRIFYNNGEFIVMVGDWLTDPQYEVDINELRELLIDEFDLPENFKFQQDEHWNIGRGWSERGF